MSIRVWDLESKGPMQLKFTRKFFHPVLLFVPSTGSPCSFFTLHFLNAPHPGSFVLSTGRSLRAANFPRRCDSKTSTTFAQRLPARARLRFSTAARSCPPCNFPPQAVLDDSGKKPAEGLGVENAFKDFDFSRAAMVDANVNLDA